MTRFVVLFAALLLLAGSAQASPFVYSPFGLQIDVGAGMKWDHSQRGSLQFQDSPWVAGGITKTMGDSRWSVTGTFERQAVQEADYLIRAGLWYRIGP